MARRTEIADETILAAALRVMLASGADLKTADVAREAEVSEGTIFKRFKTKKGLIAGAVSSVFFRDWLTALDEDRAEEDFSTVLADTLCEALKFFRMVMPLQLALVSLFGRELSVIELARQQGREPPVQTFTRKLEIYLDGLINAGKIRPCQTGVVAGLLLGSVFHRIFAELSGGRKNSLRDDLNFAEELLRVIVGGIHN